MTSSLLLDWETPRHLFRIGALADELASEGAVLVTFDGERLPCLVGALRWMPNRLLVFCANGDRAEDICTLEFDQALSSGRCIHLYLDGLPVGSLASIDDVVLDDIDAYRVGWDIWQHLEPLKRNVVRQLLDQACESDRDE